MNGACKLNNKNMRNIRREADYQCVVIDLALLGIITKEQCEMLIGTGIPANVVLPDGSSKLNEQVETTVTKAKSKASSTLED